MKKVIAIDLGAESGRVIVSDLARYDVVYKFPSVPIQKDGSLFWDIEKIFDNIKTGLKKAFADYGNQIESIGIDTWGVDYVLLDNNKQRIGLPYHYRDARTDTAMDEVFTFLPKREIFAETGIQFLQFNTIYQVYAHKKDNPKDFDLAEYFLTIPDYLNYLLTGNITNEYTNATTTQMLDPATGKWSDKIINALGLKWSLFSDVTMPGTTIGGLDPQLAEELGASGDVKVIEVACHDTGSAIVAVPATGGNYAYLSSGTWSLLGIESENVIRTDKSFDYNFTNEGAYDGKSRFLKNIMGLWILQECKRQWEESGPGPHDYDTLMKLANETASAGFIIDPNDPVFFKPGTISSGMVERIQNKCRETGQNVPQSKGEITRGIIESLAHCYSRTIDEIKKVSGKAIDELYIIGGGCKNKLLCSLTATVANIPVYAGPVEATALGNVLVQAMALGSVASLAEGRDVIRSSCGITRYDPE